MNQGTGLTGAHSGRRVAWRAVTAMLITAATIWGSSGVASADLISDIVGRSSVGGNTTPAYYSAAQFYAQTTCTGNTNRVQTTVVASPRSGSGGQWFHTRVYARDVTYSLGAWKDYGAAQTWVPETNSISYSMPDYRQVATSWFSGVDGRSYEVYVVVHGSSSGVYQFVGSATSNHYTTFGALPVNQYGVAVQALPGAASTSCKVV